MKLQIDFDEPIIKEERVLQLQPSDLNHFYVTASDFDKSNLFFMLLASFQHYLETEDQEKSAHLSFLMAYYLFTPLTPPGSFELALHYIKEAISLNPLECYTEWLSRIAQGN